MNPQDLISMAKEIYIRMAAQQPDNWDKQKMAREAIESAKQFALALQSEKEGSAYPSETQPGPNPLVVSAMANMKQSLADTPSVSQSQDLRTQTGNQMAAGRGMVRQRHWGLEMG